LRVGQPPPRRSRAAGATSLNFLAVRREKGQIERARELHAAMPSPLKRPAGQPVVLRWHPGGAGALWDENLNFHSRRELLDWAANGIYFVVLDHATGADITRVFLAHWNESHTEVIDPVGRKHD
jgi:hypothetical protein